MASYFPMVKNTAQRIVFPILDADGDPVTGAASDTPDSEYSLNGGSFSDCSNEISELATASGVYYLDLLAGETDGDVVAIQIKTATAETKTTVLVFYTSAQSLDTVDAVVDGIKSVTDNLPNSGALSDLAAILTDTGTTLPATLATILGYIDAEVQAIIDDLANATDGLGALKTLIDAIPTTAMRGTDNVVLLGPTKAQMDTAHGLLATPAQVATALGNYDGPTRTEATSDKDAIITEVNANETKIDALQDPTVGAIADAVWDELLTGALHNTATSAGRRLRVAGFDELITRENTCQAGEDATHVKLDSGASGTNNFYDHMWMILTGGTGAGQIRLIDDYVGATFVAEVHPAWLTNPDETSTFAIIARAQSFTHEISPEGLAGIQAEMEENGASILDTLQDRLTSIRAGNLDQLDFTLQEAIAAIPTTMRGTDNVVLAGPTKAEMDTAHALLATPTQVASELGTYDSPTKAEMDAALLIMKQKVAGAFDRETDSLEAIRDRGDTAWVTGAGGDATEAKQDIIDTVVDAIRVVIDKLADTLELDGAVYRFTLNALEEAPSGTGGDATAANQLLLIKILTNKWEVTGNQFILYDDDGTTPLYTFDLTQDGIATEFNPDLRTPV